MGEFHRWRLLDTLRLIRPRSVRVDVTWLGSTVSCSLGHFLAFLYVLSRSRKYFSTQLLGRLLSPVIFRILFVTATTPIPKIRPRIMALNDSRSAEVTSSSSFSRTRAASLR